MSRGSERLTVFMHSPAHAFSVQWKLIKLEEACLNSPKLEVR